MEVTIMRTLKTILAGSIFVILHCLSTWVFNPCGI